MSKVAAENPSRPGMRNRKPGQVVVYQVINCYDWPAQTCVYPDKQLISAGGKRTAAALSRPSPGKGRYFRQVRVMLVFQRLRPNPHSAQL